MRNKRKCQNTWLIKRSIRQKETLTKPLQKDVTKDLDQMVRCWSLILWRQTLTVQLPMSVLLLVKTVGTWELPVLYLTSLTTRCYRLCWWWCRCHLWAFAWSRCWCRWCRSWRRNDHSLHCTNWSSQSNRCLRESGVEEFQVTELEMIPQSEVELSGEDLETFENFTAFLKTTRDVQKIYTNVDGF